MMESFPPQHPHHDGAVFLSSSMVLMDRRTPEAAIIGFYQNQKNKGENNLFLLPLFNSLTAHHGLVLR
jgi:hypothetical protein